MKIYTRTGDRGETGMAGGKRVPKSDLCVEVCGTIDELNAVLGLARAETLPAEIDAVVASRQHELFTLGAMVAYGDPAALGLEPIGQTQITQMEAAIDRLEATLEPLAAFILPGGTRAAATLHLARTVCRRAERRLVSLAQQGVERPVLDAVAYLNRLSDLLFVLARAANAEAQVADVPWEKG